MKEIFDIAQMVVTAVILLLLAVNIILEGITASQEKRDWTISHQRTSPELVIRESTQAVP